MNIKLFPLFPLQIRGWHIKQMSKICFIMDMFSITNDTLLGHHISINGSIITRGSEQSGGQ